MTFYTHKLYSYLFTLFIKIYYIIERFPLWIVLIKKAFTLYNIEIAYEQ